MREATKAFDANDEIRLSGRVFTEVNCGGQC